MSPGMKARAPADSALLIPGWQPPSSFIVTLASNLEGGLSAGATLLFAVSGKGPVTCVYAHKRVRLKVATNPSTCAPMLHRLPRLNRPNGLKRHISATMTQGIDS
jgi:hypothetical protein